MLCMAMAVAIARHACVEVDVGWRIQVGQSWMTFPSTQRALQCNVVSNCEGGEKRVVLHGMNMCGFALAILGDKQLVTLLPAYPAVRDSLD